MQDARNEQRRSLPAGQGIGFGVDHVEHGAHGEADADKDRHIDEHEGDGVILQRNTTAGEPPMRGEIVLPRRKPIGEAGATHVRFRGNLRKS